MRPKGRSARRALCAGLIFSALFLAWAGAAQAAVYEHVPNSDPSFSATGGVGYNPFQQEIFVAGRNSTGFVVQDYKASKGDELLRTMPFGTLSNPRGIFYDENNQALYLITEGPSGEEQVLELEHGAVAPIILPVGTLSSSASQLAVDLEGDVFVADDGNHRVIELPHGSTTPEVVPITGLQGADGISINGNTLAVADETGKQVVTWNISTHAQSTVALPSGTVPGPIAYGRFGSLYVYDRGSTNVIEIPVTGSDTTLPTEPTGSVPGGIAGIGEGSTRGGFFLTNNNQLNAGIDTTVTQPKLISSFYDGEDSKVDAPIALNDPHNIRIPFTYSPPQESTGEEFVGFTVISSNPAVLPSQDVTIGRSIVSDEYTLAFAPIARGEVELTLVAQEDPANAALSLFTTMRIEVPVAPEPKDSTERFLLGSANASSELSVGEGYFLDADDDGPVLRMYKGETTGYPVRSWEPSGVEAKNVDFEAMARKGNQVYEADSFAEGVGKSPLIDWQIIGEGAETQMVEKDVSFSLEEELIAWDNSRGKPLGLEASSPPSLQKEVNGEGIALEGMEFAPNGTTAYLAFRVPLEPPSGAGERTESLIIPVTNFTELFTPGNHVAAQFGEPILWKLGGLGIREIRRNADDEYLIITGPPGDSEKNHAAPQALWEWDGVPTDLPRKLKTDVMEEPPLLHGSTAWEGIAQIPDPIVQGAKVTLVQDDGKAEPAQRSQKSIAFGVQRAMSDVFTIDLGEAENLTPPSISGVAAVGKPVTCQPGSWTQSPSFAFTWLRDGSPVASGQSYSPTEADAGQQLACEVTATDAEGSTEATSAAVQPLPAAPAGATGPQGPAGGGGAPGSGGAQGATGLRGAQGEHGKNATVACKVTKTKGSPHVTCTVTGGGSGNDRTLRLVRGDHTVAKGHGAHLEAASRLPKGDYTLVEGTGKATDRIAVVVG